ncbi:mixed lineage kinase domain-like protein [Hyperolius riggenbachi]|uniref:mixed lineage kinase domain-like protein n=1 Tax=Hyperolius riggenbachi TaxID=752182 RepID=UPI0035A3C8DA
MEVLTNILSVAQTIYDLCDTASSNKQQCRRLKRRIKMLVLTAQTLKKQPSKSAALQIVLEDMELTIDNAKCWVIKYSHHAWWRQVIQANSIKEEFQLINDRLGDAANSMSDLLVAEHRGKFNQFFDETTRRRQNEKDIQQDLAELKEYLKSHVSGVEDRMDNIGNTLDDISTRIAEISLVCHRPTWNIAEIRVTDLIRGDLMLERPSHFLYRGELHRSPVAIKVFKSPKIESADYIRKIFLSESEMMKKFECLNILRLYGICIDHSDPQSCYSLVMELCEKGTLRDLLQREPDLSWERRVLMALDAARALYRLHQTELKAILHGSLSSSKFLVDGTYCVKLSGFELSKTESSIRRPSNVERRSKHRELEYIAPETWKDINAYDKRSELYSLGVIMYEIATGKRPFQNEEVTANNLEMWQEKSWASLDEDLPPSCPRILRNLIKRLVQKNPANRPSAGVIVDLLMSHLNQRDSKSGLPEAVA